MSRIRTARLQVRNPDRSYASGSSAGEGIPVARIRLICREKVKKMKQAVRPIQNCAGTKGTWSTILAVNYSTYSHSLADRRFGWRCHQVQCCITQQVLLSQPVWLQRSICNQRRKCSDTIQPSLSWTPLPCSRLAAEGNYSLLTGNFSPFPFYSLLNPKIVQPQMW